MRQSSPKPRDKHTGSGELIGLHKRTSRGLNPLLGGLSGAVVALVLAYVGSYLQTRFGFGVVGTRGSRVTGAEVFVRSALNLYALHHVPLEGTGQIHDSFGSVVRVSASIVLPLTVWSVIPLAALLVGGFAVGSGRPDAGYKRTILCGVFCGILYGAALGCLTPLVRGKLDFFLLPQVGGLAPNPPPIEFYPSASGALLNGCSFGAAFSMLGALFAASRLHRKRGRSSKWWACGKAVFVCALIVQTLFALALLGYVLFESESAEASNQRIVEMLPTAAGLGYSMIHGAALISSVESQLKGGPVQKAFYARVDLYGVIQKGNETRRVDTALRIVALFVVAAVGVVGGRLAVRWGSVDGSLPTGFRCALLHSAYLSLLPKLCSMFLRQSDPISSVSISIGALFGWRLLVSFGCVLVCAIIGAQSYRRSRLFVQPS
ncbi:MAG: hypothetical protein QHI38_00120 [Armatimonadota bacterium]|nr:hypothetical protein [Armatimonadota bacterium]